MENTWAPSASIETLRLRAKVIARIREFFSIRNVLEVDTPLLSHGTITDPHIQAMASHFKSDGVLEEKKLYLQTSPEYAMKRLLAAGIGDCYQLCKAFRQGEVGRHHNPEFSVLEWYRLGFDHVDLMKEVDALLQCVLKTAPAEFYSYEEIFQKYLKINPLDATVDELINCAALNAIHITGKLDRDGWLNVLMTHCIEPNLGQHNKPAVIYDFPASQAALAKIRNSRVASRFEFYFKGIELANGFHELLDPQEQRKRFLADLDYRQKNKLPVVPMDERFLKALEQGMPECAGVALGIDRLVMLALSCDSIQEVLSFDLARA